MGGTYFSNVVRGINNVHEAFRSEYQSSGFQDGYSYSGTISSTDFAGVYTNNFMSLGEANLINKEVEKGYCYGVPLLAEDDTKMRKIEGTITLTKGADEGQRSAEFKAAFDKLVKLKPNEYVSENYFDQISEVATVVADTSVLATTATEKKFFVKHIHFDQNDLKWEKGYKTQAEARAAAIAYMESQFNRRFGGIDTIEVVAMTRRVNGDPLLRFKKKVKKVTYQVTVYVNTVIPGKQDGWFFFGVAPS
jgi:hypothetical protein